MGLALSSAAAPELELPELLATCARRGIEGLELVAGHAHGVAPGIGSREVARLRRELASARVRLTGLYLGEEMVDGVAEAARLAIAFGVPLVAPVAVGSPAVLGGIAAMVVAEGGRILIRHGMDQEEASAVEELVEAHGCNALGVAWELRPRLDDPAATAAILRRIPARLAYIRLHGGGPEAEEMHGRGVGALMSRLAAGRYAGPLVLTPSTPRYRQAWRGWLGRTRGWGCGSQVEAQSLHSLQPR